MSKCEKSQNELGVLHVEVRSGSFGEHGVSHINDQLQDPLIGGIGVGGGFLEFLLGSSLRSVIKAREGNLNG